MTDSKWRNRENGGAVLHHGLLVPQTQGAAAPGFQLTCEWIRNEIDTVEDVVVLSFSRPRTTSAVTRGAARLAAALGYSPLLEVTLPNGRRADIMALGPRGQFMIIEVKSGLDDFRVDRKWVEYLAFCDTFYFAVAPEFPVDALPVDPGLIVADGFDGAVVRPSPHAPLAGARRKALTLAFARLAAMRTIGDADQMPFQSPDAE